MKKIRDEILYIYKHQNSFYLSDYTRGRIDGLETADDFIGSCNACKYSFIAGSDLRCRYRMFSLSTDGYCELFEERKKDEDNQQG